METDAAGDGEEELVEEKEKNVVGLDDVAAEVAAQGELLSALNDKQDKFKEELNDKLEGVGFKQDQLKDQLKDELQDGLKRVRDELKEQLESVFGDKKDMYEQEIAMLKEQLAKALAEAARKRPRMRGS